MVDLPLRQPVAPNRPVQRVAAQFQPRQPFCRKDVAMRLVIIAVGRLKQGPERELAERYRERFDDIGRRLGFRGLEVCELPESRAREATTRIDEEAASVSAAIPPRSVL